MAEELKGYDLIAWFAIMAPAGTPKDIVQLLYERFTESLSNTRRIRKIRHIGTDVAPMNPAQLARSSRAKSPSGRCWSSRRASSRIVERPARRRPHPRPHHGRDGAVRDADPRGFGADVVKLEPPEGDVMRTTRRCAPRAWGTSS
jgi:hypothetical protein